MDEEDDPHGSGKVVAFPSTTGPKEPPAGVDRAIGAAIRRRRLALHMTQGTLAEAVGVTLRDVRRYEMGELKLSSRDIIGLAGGLGFSVTALLALAEDLPDDSRR